MFGSQILEIAIGLVFVNLLLSAICSAISEWIAHFTNLRAKTLEAGVRSLLLDIRDGDDRELVRKFYEHPFVKALVRSGKKFGGSAAPSMGAAGPSYIPSRVFAVVLLDIIAKTDSQNTPTQAVFPEPMDIHVILDRLKPGEGREALKTLVSDVRNDAMQCRMRIEKWFDQNMEQVSVWYKRRTQKIILTLSVLLVSALNIDALSLANALYRDEALRELVVETSIARVKNQNAQDRPDSAANAAESLAALEDLKITLGWDTSSAAPVFSSRWAKENLLSQDPFLGWTLKVIGLALSALAAAQGAPFWFDVLGKLVNLRMSGQRPTKEK